MSWSRAWVMVARLMTGSSASSASRTPDSQRSTERAQRRPRPGAPMDVGGGGGLGALEDRAADRAVRVSQDLDRGGEVLEPDALEAGLVLLFLVDDHLF